jgi:predicted MFS family arabinose efflux permease
MQRRPLIFVLFAIAYFLSYFFRSANAAIAGDLRRDLGLTPEQLGLMTSLFYAGFAAIQLPIGVGLDRLGARWVTPSLMLLSAAGCLVFASAQSFWVLALGRALIGLGMAGVLMGALKAFGAWYSPTRIATVAGLLVGLGSLGGPFAATPLTWLNASYGWRAIFGWGAPAIVLSAAALMAGVRNAPPGVDWHAGAAGGAGLGQIFRDTRFWRIALVNFFQLGTIAALQGLWGGPYLLDVAGLGKLAVGNMLLAMGAGVVFGFFVCGWLADRFGMGRAVTGSMAVMLLGLVGLALPARLPLALIGVIYFAIGCCGSFNIVELAQIRALFPPHRSGRAVTAVNLFGFAGSALLQWWMGLIIGAFAPDAAGRYPPIAYAAAFGAAALGVALALAWYLPIGQARAAAAGLE